MQCVVTECLQNVGTILCGNDVMVCGERGGYVFHFGSMLLTWSVNLSAMADQNFDGPCRDTRGLVEGQHGVYRKTGETKVIQVSYITCGLVSIKQNIVKPTFYLVQKLPTGSLTQPKLSYKTHKTYKQLFFVEGCVYLKTFFFLPEVGVGYRSDVTHLRLNYSDIRKWVLHVAAPLSKQFARFRHDDRIERCGIR